MKVWEAAANLRSAGRQEKSESDGPGRAGLRDPRAGAGRPAPKAWEVPPVGNTGGKLTSGLTVKLDWLNVTFPATKRDAVVSLVGEYLGEPEHHAWGRHTYREHLAWPTSAALFWSDGRAEALLSLNADSIDCIPLDRQLKLLGQLEDLGAKGTKIDVALDDYERRVSIDQIEAAYMAGQVVGFRLGQRQNPRRWESRELQSVGDSFDLGRRGTNGSGKALKVYDKLLESRGTLDCIRWELRLSGERAETAFECLASSLSLASFVRKLTQYVGGCVDFKADPDETHLDRRERLPWWQKLLDVIDSARLVVHRTIPPLQKSLNYLRETWAKKLALGRVIIEGLGGDFFGWVSDVVDEGEKRIDWNRAGGLDLGLDLQLIGAPRALW